MPTTATSQLPLDEGIQDVAYDLTRQRMAAVSRTQDSDATNIKVLEAAVDRESWNLVSGWQISADITSLAWASPEFGRLFIASTSSGMVLAWQCRSLQGAQTSNEMDDEELYAQIPGVKVGNAPIRQVVFAPRQIGLVFAALCQDGSVCVYEADRVLSPRSWTLQSKFQVAPGSPCMCWRPHSASVPPLLCIASQTRADVWQYVTTLMAWQRVAAMETSQDVPVTSVHWAPPLGRPQELVALAAGQQAEIFGLSGDTGHLQAEGLAVLAQEAVVWRVEWDLLGSQLAVCTADQHVHVYRADLVGSWQKVALIEGQVQEGQDGPDLDVE